MNLRIPAKIHDVLRVPDLLRGEHRPHRSLSGGRGSGKSRSFSQLLVARSFGFVGGTIYCTRALQTSLAESSKPSIDWAIGALGVHEYFDVLDKEVRNKLTGVRFVFQGLERKRASIRGWENVRICWVGEAQHVTEPTAQILTPTVHRFPGAEIWLDWNPYLATDWVYKRFAERPQHGDLHIHTTWRDNPFFPPGLERERLAAKAGDPEEYEHVWEGALLPRSGGFRVFPMQRLKLCRSVRPKGDFSEFPAHGGFDPGAGGDTNGLAVRRGPVVELIDQMAGKGPQVAARLRDEMVRAKAETLYYDAGVVVTQPPDGEWRNEPVLFGAAVKGPKVHYTAGIRNSEHFFRRNSQLAFALKQRAEATWERFHNGDVSVAEEDCLFLPSDTSDEVLQELSQPTWSEGPTSKIQIEKAHEGESSPNRYDALALAFASDSASGLRHYRSRQDVRFIRVG